QSYGAVSIIKVKAYWFHVRERGLFGAIFGTLISMGVYFAIDWGQAIVEAAKVQQQGQLTPFQTAFKWLFAVDTGTHDAIWLVFFIPAVLLVFWALIDMFLIKDSPSETGFEDFDTADASSGEMEQDFTVGQLLKKIFTNPVMLTIAAVEFTSGVLRNGTQQWYFIFAKEVPQPGAEIFMKHWGLFLCITGIMGGFASGAMSDKIFHSRRGPPAAIMSGLMLTCLILMAIFLLDAPVVVGACVLVIAFAVIGVHSIMSGTAAADFGGRKATATASGITDGFVYLGSGIQSVCLGFLTTKDWEFWPVFLAPFALLGLVLALRMWRELPAATRKYLETVEKIDIRISSKKTVIKTTSSLSLTDG
ncbi:MAG: MFS transporter, partial [Bacteriovoracia bacterium]